MIVNHTSPYGGTYKLQASYGKHANGQTRIQLYDVMDGMPYATATVVVDDILNTDEVAIKDYSENDGILESLIEAGIVSEPIAYKRSGFIQIPICKLLTKTE